MSTVDRRSFFRLSSGAAVTTAAFAVSLGPVPAWADGRGDEGPDDPHPSARQFRAMWISLVENIDWPSEPGLDAEAQQEEFETWMDLARELGLNAVISQVRPTADAIWPSPHEPWSQYLTGQQGLDPGYDPLAFQVEAAHARNLEYHAWFNPYRVAMTDDPSTLVEDHPARVHPEWVFAYGGQLYYDPGIPEVRAFVQDAMLDAVVRYDVDGAHFDDYFYPYPVEGEEIPDEETFAEHSDGSESIEDWRRENVNLLVKEMHERIHEQKPWVRFGISPFGIWRNSSSDPDGSDTSGSESYDMISADSLTWVREGWVDYINPQVYWEFGNEAADYETLAKWWAGAVEGTGVALYIGEAAYKATDGTFPDPAELGDHLDLTTQLEQVDGNVYFSAVSLRDDTTGFVEDLVERHYEHPALVPVIDSIPGQAPEEPTLISVQRTGTGVLLRWTGRGTDATSYAIWRLPSEQAREKDLADRRNLVATMRDDGPGLQEFVHDGADGSGWYVVTAYDRTWRQSDPSDAQEARG